MRSHYLCSGADNGEDAQAPLLAHGYVEAIWGHTSHRRMLVVLHPDADVERVDHLDHLVYQTDPGEQRVGLAMVRTVSHVRRVTTVQKRR
jgi:hypothetical protein